MGFGGALGCGVEVRADQLSDPLLSIGPTFGWSWRVHPTVEWTGDFPVHLD